MKFCPQCHLLLSSSDCDGIPILACGTCGGCWFPSKSLDDAIASQQAALAELDLALPGGTGSENYVGLTAYCPECRTEPLSEWTPPGLPSPLLECPKCEGVWVRSGLRRALAESRQPENERENAKEAIAASETDNALVAISDNDGETTEGAPSPVSSEISQREPERTATSEINYLAANEQYAARFVHGHLPRIPARKLAIITCMDARMQVYEILGLKPGDANIIRNAGGIVTEDVLRSLIVSHHLLGTKEVLIINHTDCGLLAIEEESFRDRLTDETGSAAIVPAVFHAFKDLEKNVRTQVLKIRSHPWIPSEIKVRGFVYDVRTGLLHEVA